MASLRTINTEGLYEISLINSLSGKVGIDLYDMAGNKVKCIYEGLGENLSQLFEVDLTDLEKGVYICNIRSGHSDQSLRMLKR